jgi:hypothetical protein
MSAASLKLEITSLVFLNILPLDITERYLVLDGSPGMRQYGVRWDSFTGKLLQL